MRQTYSGCWLIESDADALAFEKAVQEYAGACSVGVDAETYPDDPKRKTPDAAQDHLLGMGVAIYREIDDENTCWQTFYGDVMQCPEYGNALVRTMPRTPWYAHNAMFDGTVARHHGIRFGEHWGDARIIAYLLGEPEAGLKPLLWSELGVNTKEYRDLLDDYGATDLRGVPFEVVAEYCGSQDAELCPQLERSMRAKLTPRQDDIYQVELTMVNTLIDMHMRGIAFDREAAAPLLAQAVKAKDGLDAVISRMVEETGFVQWERRGGVLWRPTCKACRNGKKKRETCEPCEGKGKLDPVKKPFNSGSADQVRAFLYDHLGLPMRRYAQGVQEWMIEAGKVEEDEVRGATDELALLQLRDRHPTVPLILSRKKQKKDAEFLGKWLALSEPDSRLHTQFTNTTVASGRLSSFDPNLQQVTQKRRSLFVADEGCEIVAGDMSQLELVISAYMSRDPVMLEIINNGWDMHCITAEAIYGIPWQQIPKDSPLRAVAKVANYLTSYGGKAAKLIEGIEKLALQRPEMNLTIPDMAEAKRILAAHKRKYARYWEWVSWTIMLCRQNGFSETAFGRPRFFPDITSQLDIYKGDAERACVNHAIQGTAADLMKMAMRNVAADELMSSWGYMVLQVHDEIVSVVRKEFVAAYRERLRTHMELGQPFAPYVNLTVDVLSGPNWRDCHK